MGINKREKKKRKESVFFSSISHLSSLLTKFKVLSSLQANLRLIFAVFTLQSQDNLLGCLGLFVEDGLGLTTITLLLVVVSSLTLSKVRGLASFVLRDLVPSVLLASLALAVGSSFFRNVHHISLNRAI